jgi:DNA-binding SARP family transcriptional activator
VLNPFLRATDGMSGSFPEREEWQETIRTDRSILARDNLWERAHRLMITAYAQLGRRTRALHVYRDCGQRLREELDVAPSLATRPLDMSIFESTVPLPVDLS